MQLNRTRILTSQIITVHDRLVASLITIIAKTIFVGHYSMSGGVGQNYMGKKTTKKLDSARVAIRASLYGVLLDSDDTVAEREDRGVSAYYRGIRSGVKKDFLYRNALWVAVNRKDCNDNYHGYDAAMSNNSAYLKKKKREKTAKVKKC